MADLVDTRYVYYGMFGSGTAGAQTAVAEQPQSTGGSNRSIDCCNCLKLRRLHELPNPLRFLSPDFGSAVGSRIAVRE